MENLGKHPFNYSFDDIKNHIIDLTESGLFDYALKTLDYIKFQYLTGRNSGEICSERFPFYDLKAYHMSDLGHELNGSRYSDGSKYKLILRLNQLINLVKRKSGKNPDSKANKRIKLRNAATNGIVLFYLMNYGNSGFKLTSNKDVLTTYMEKLNIQGSGQQAYNKGIVHLIENEKRNKERKYNYFTQDDFLQAIKFLKEKDIKSYKAAQSDYGELILDDLNAERGDDPRFFRK